MKTHFFCQNSPDFPRLGIGWTDARRVWQPKVAHRTRKNQATEGWRKLASSRQVRHNFFYLLGKSGEPRLLLAKFLGHWAAANSSPAAA